MSLFQLSDLEKQIPIAEKETKVHWHSSTASQSAMISGSFPDVLDGIVAELKKAKSEINIHYTSIGAFSMHQLLTALLSISGPAAVFISTWAMTEIPCRHIAMLIRENKITSLKLIFDHKIKTRSASAVQLAEQLATSVLYTKCHAKTTVIRNEQFGITIIGSANYTRNPRIESGVIVLNKNVADWNTLWMERATESTTTDLSDDID